MAIIGCRWDSFFLCLRPVIYFPFVSTSGAWMPTEKDFFSHSFYGSRALKIFPLFLTLWKTKGLLLPSAETESQDGNKEMKAKWGRREINGHKLCVSQSWAGFVCLPQKKGSRLMGSQTNKSSIFFIMDLMSYSNFPFYPFFRRRRGLQQGWLLLTGINPCSLSLFSLSPLLILTRVF